MLRCGRGRPGEPEPDAEPADKTVLVLVVGVGDVAGPHPALSENARAALTDLWLTVCQRAGAASCTVDPTPVVQTPPVTTTLVTSSRYPTRPPW
jgi:hypothetical protein